MGNGESTSFAGCQHYSAVRSGGNFNVLGKSLNKSPDEDDLIRIKSKCLASRELPEDRLERYIKQFTVSTEHLKLMFEAFVDELQLGVELFRDASSKGTLIDPKKCSFKMLDSCVKDIPTGEESGVCYAIDFGGTNLRAVRLEFKGNGNVHFSQEKTSLTGAHFPHPKGLMDKDATATELFDHFAVTVRGLMEQHGDLNRDDEDIAVGFTFSFPCRQWRIDSAQMVVWTKEFETGRGTNDPVEGQDVCELLQMAFRRNHVPAKVSAVLNDTVGTMLSCAYEVPIGKHPRCRVGIILGTGVNACYFDDNCSFYNYQGNIINIECGGFNRELPRTNVDLECDFASTSNRGDQMLEKMISGAYIGEICRRAIVHVLQRGSPSLAWQANSLSGEDAARIVSDTSDDLVEVCRVLEDRWAVVLSYTQCDWIKQLCTQIYDRSAALAAVIIAACAKKSGYLQPAMGGLSVGVDGSLYKCNHFYRAGLRRHLDQILEENYELVHLLMADDGSGKGAGVLASIS